MINVQNIYSNAMTPGSAITQAGASKFPNPFCDIASEYVPRDLEQIFEWSEYLYLTFGTYRQAARRVVRYFLTELVLDGESDDERKSFEEFLNDELHITSRLAEIGDDFMCFAGDTPVITRQGMRRISTLEGTTVDVLTPDGEYRPAPFKCYGEQPLFRVEFSDGTSLRATADHQWWDTAGDVVTTMELPGRSINRVLPPRPAEGSIEWESGYTHGKIYAGVVYSGEGTDINMLPIDADPEYIYGFISAYLEASGAVTRQGGVMLYHCERASLEAIAALLPAIGMLGGRIRRSGDQYILPLIKRYMLERDFMNPTHQERFTGSRTGTVPSDSVRVLSVTPTGRTEKVYCCREPETDGFVVGNGIVTHNCYGNVFVSIYFPFDRFLICPTCHTQYHIDTIAYKFNLKDASFTCTCPKCGHSGEFGRVDRRSPDRAGVNIIRWNPKRIRLRVHPISGTTEYFLQIDPTFVRKISESNRFYIKYTPWALLEYCSKAGLNGTALFKFNDDAIYHMKESTLAGLPIRGWGIPPILPNFKLAYYMQILRRYDEAIALDYIVPFRVLYPEGGTLTGGMTQDPVQLMAMSTFSAHMQKLVANKRKNITDIQVAPFRIGYELIGGEAKALAPKESIAQALDELLNATGFPAELYKGSLSIQAFPVALRLFEKTWGTLVDGYNDLISWLLTKIARYYQWGEMTGRLRSVTLADDLERKALALQAAAGQDISKETAYQPLDIDYMEEQRRVIEEQQAIQKLQQEAMEAAQAQEMGGGGADGSGGPGGQAGATPGDVHQQAQELANQLLTQTPDSLRRGELIKIKHSNPTLHALVLQYMDEQRQEMARQGQAMMMQQAKQASADLNEYPSTMSIGLLVASEVMDYRRDDLRKIAAAALRNPAAEEAFSFVYRKIRDWPARPKVGADGLPRS